VTSMVGLLLILPVIICKELFDAPKLKRAQVWWKQPVHELIKAGDQLLFSW